MDDELTAQARAALAVYLIFQAGEAGLSEGDLQIALGYKTPEGAYHLMANVAYRVPVIRGDDRRWRFMPNR